MDSQVSKLIIKDLCLRLKITEKQALEMIRSQYREVRGSIESGDLDNIRLPKFGLFAVKHYRKKKDETQDRENGGEDSNN